MVAPHSFPVLVLNADFRPLSYHPLSLWTWQEAIKAIFLEKVHVVSQYEQEVHSTRLTLKLPSIIALKEYISTSRKPPFTRYNVFLRDKFQCQYCGEHFTVPELTIDHVIPRSKGGATSWDNVVSACRNCNAEKGSYLPHEIKMYPLNKPHAPSKAALHAIARETIKRDIPPSWHDYLLQQKVS